MMTSKKGKTGLTGWPRAAGKAAKNARVIINIQGDEPVISPALIDSVARCFLNDEKLAAATAAYPLKDKREIENPSVVKVVFGANRERAVFFALSHTLPEVSETAGRLL